MRTRVVLDRERRPCRRRERWLRRGRAREVPERSLATDCRRDRTSSRGYEAGVSDLERFERERVLGNSFVNLLRILPIVQQRGLEAGRPDVRQSLVELLLVGLHNLVSLNDFPHAEPCPSDFGLAPQDLVGEVDPDRKSTRLNSSHSQISYAVFCLKKKKKIHDIYLYYINNKTVHIYV